MNIHLEYYRIFYYVAQQCSITAASELLHISQPAVSQSIRQLEESMNCKLFVRMPKGVKLTPEGEALFSYVERGYETILQGEDTVRRMLDLEQGEIRIGASDMTLKYYLLPFLEEFHTKYPKIKVAVTNGPTPETLKYLSEGKIDFGVVSGPIECNEDIEAIDVKIIRDVFVAGSRFNDFKGKKLDWKVLEELPIISLEQDTSSRRYIDKVLAGGGVTLHPEFELSTSDMIVQFALRNLGIGAVVESFASEYVAKGELFELAFSQTIPPRKFCIVTSRRAAVAKSAQKLLDILVSSGKM